MKHSLLSYYQDTKRDLPWRKTQDPYRIWVSEIFLQQTQVSRVIEFYLKFIAKFPHIAALSKASWEEFVPYFQGLGFYSRGRNMLKTAQIIKTEYAGKFPENKSDLEKLPGIGDYTSSAIMSFAYKKNYPAFDVNLYRVMGRFFGYSDKPEKKEQDSIKRKAYEIFYTEEIGNQEKKNSADLLNHAFMDLGATICTAKKANCAKCPLKKECKFHQQEKTIQPSKKRKKEAAIQNKNIKQVSVMILHHQKKYFLISSPQSQNWDFPQFTHEEEMLQKKSTLRLNHRHFLQEKSLLTFGIEISVRPPFAKVIREKTEYLFSRCQILRGEFFPEIFDTNEKNIAQFYTKTEISELIQQKKTPEEFSEIFEKILKMRF